MLVKTLMVVALVGSVAQSLKHKVVEQSAPPPPPPPAEPPSESGAYLRVRAATKGADSLRAIPVEPPRPPPLPLAAPQPATIAYVILRPLQPAAFPLLEPISYGPEQQATRYTRPYTLARAPGTKGGDQEQMEQQQQQIEQQHELPDNQEPQHQPQHQHQPALVIPMQDKPAKLAKFKAALDQLLAKFAFSSYQVVGEEMVGPPPPPPPPIQQQQEEEAPVQQQEQVPQAEEQLPAEQPPAKGESAPARPETVKEPPRRPQQQQQAASLQDAKTRQSRVVF